jgi:hypothetical protein
MTDFLGQSKSGDISSNIKISFLSFDDFSLKPSIYNRIFQFFFLGGEGGAVSLVQKFT